MAELITVNSKTPEPERIVRAAELVRRGEVIGFPTDTIYGLAADPFNPSAVKKVFAIKERPATAPLLLLVDSLEMAAACAVELPSLFRLLASRFWPGPLTIVVEAGERLLGAVTANTGRIGLRLPSATVPLALVRAVGGPVTATSANLAGAPDCRTAADVQAALGARLPLILDGGPSPLARPSTVVGISSNGWELIREGAIPASEIHKALSTSLS